MAKKQQNIKDFAQRADKPGTIISKPYSQETRCIWK